jgi:SAM-dependent methyltransferase
LGSPSPSLARRAIEALKPFVPTAVKRRVIRVLPPRFYGLVDRDWHRRAVGGRWEELGRLQFDYLRSAGLHPEHYLLDVGCGSLRGGVHFIRFLEAGHYVGIDKNPDRLEAGRRIELPRYGLEHKQPVLEVVDDFDVGHIGCSFDFALAQSVFTHLPRNLIELCIAKVGAVLVPGGRFYATFNARRAGEEAMADRSNLPFEKDPIYRYEPEILRSLGEDAGLAVDVVADWGHPRSQAMLVFTKD